MLAILRQIGLLVGSAKGWAVLLGSLPSMGVVVTGLYEGMLWPQIISYSTFALAMGLVAVVLILHIWERGTLFLTSRKEQDQNHDPVN